MQLDVESLATDALQEPAPTSLTCAMKRLSIGLYFSKQGRTDSLSIVASRQEREILQKGATVLEQTSPDRFMERNFVQILDAAGTKSPPLNAIENIALNIFRGIVLKMGEEIEFTAENLHSIRREITQRVMMMQSLNEIDRVNIIIHIVKSIIVQRVREIFSKRGLAKRSASEFVSVTDPEAETLLQIKQDMIATTLRVGNLLGITLHLPKS